MDRKILGMILCASALVVLATGCSSGTGQAREEEGRATVPCVTLNDGREMPMLGLGTWTQDDATAARSVYVALKEGYRLIDTARYYGNERGVGEGVRRAIDEGIVSREEVFVTSKIMPGDYSDPDAAIDASVAALGLGHIDLMLIHQPGSNDKEVYRALERGARAGKLRSIGISNYYTPEAIDRMIDGVTILPAVVQNENHPYYQNTALQEHLKRYGTVVESWYPLGGRGHTQELFGDPTIQAIAKAHGKAPAQIILRWHIQAGYVTIPGSQDPQHIAENIDIFDFELSEEEMGRMAALDKGRRYESW